MQVVPRLLLDNRLRQVLASYHDDVWRRATLLPS